MECGRLIDGSEERRCSIILWYGSEYFCIACQTACEQLVAGVGIVF